MEVGEMIIENKASYKIYYDGHTFQCCNEIFNRAFTGIRKFDYLFANQKFIMRIYNGLEDLIINLEFHIFPCKYRDGYYHTLNTYKQFIDVFFQSIPSYYSLQTSYSYIGEFNEQSLHLWFGKLVVGASPFDKTECVTSKIDKDFVLRGKMTDYLEFRHKELVIRENSFDELFMKLYIINDIVQQYYKINH